MKDYDWIFEHMEPDCRSSEAVAAQPREPTCVCGLLSSDDSCSECAYPVSRTVSADVSAQFVEFLTQALEESSLKVRKPVEMLKSPLPRVSSEIELPEA